MKEVKRPENTGAYPARERWLVILKYDGDSDADAEPDGEDIEEDHG